MHYELLRQMTPQPEGADRQTVKVCRNEAQPGDPYAMPIEAWPLEGVPWELCLSRALEIGKDVEASLAEIAACCLWHTSFFGFADGQLHDAYRECYDDPEESRRIREKYARYLPTVKEMFTGSTSVYRKTDESPGKEIRIDVASYSL